MLRERFRRVPQCLGAACAISLALCASGAAVSAAHVRAQAPAAGVRPAATTPSPDPARFLTYVPTELVHTVYSREQVEGFIGDLGGYDIGQALLQMPRFGTRGTVKLPESNALMLHTWAEAARGYESAHGTPVTVTAVFNASLKPRGLNLELQPTRARMIAAIQSALATGIGGVQLDLEPYPTGPGYLELLEELDAALARAGFTGRLSVVAPGDSRTWTPAYLTRVGELVDQIDPTFYDTESAGVAAYQELIETGLAYYTAAVPARAAIVPVIPCYSPDPWHNPAIENVRTATAALQSALAAGSRVQGAGLWWWYAFYYGHYAHGNAAVEREAWLDRTVQVPYSPL